MPPGAKRSYRRVTPRGSGVGFWRNLCRQGRDGPLGSVFFPDPGGVTCLLPFLSLTEQMFLLYHFVPGGTNVFIVPLCALRNKCFHCTIVRLAIINVFIVPFVPCDNKCFYCTIVCLAEQMFSLYHCAPCGLKC